MCIYFLIVITLELYSEIGSTRSVWMEKDISEYNCVYGCTRVLLARGNSFRCEEIVASRV